ncbi:CorA family metal ion transporter [Aspergillus luchuensis]|uniref:CorA family metal ion transporter n=1 Tax=Aspergillus kawachii TaxID=1069201 RepID=A0A146FZJ7_ASPKA|nr:CorA family metal ion transporter [Aspergillus luchuensis]
MWLFPVLGARRERERPSRPIFRLLIFNPFTFCSTQTILATSSSGLVALQTTVNSHRSRYHRDFPPLERAGLSARRTTPPDIHDVFVDIRFRPSIRQ